jgi:serine protease Do
MNYQDIRHVIGRSRAVTGAAVAAAVVAGLAAGAALTPGGSDAATPQPQPLPRGTTVAPGMLPADFTAVIEQVSPAVVNIQVTGHAAPEQAGPQAMPKGMEEFFKRFFGENGPEGFDFRSGPQGRNKPQARGPVMKGLGSGFIVDADGHIVTNNHVIGEAEKITVTLQDGSTHKAKLIGMDPETDLALIKIDAGRKLPFVKFSQNPTPRPGQWVIAVGNPFGLDHTATTGIVSATGRAIGAGPYDDFIQIDAPINKGNSGGPTFDLRGEVVGVNTAIFSPSGGSVGIGFAIPSSTARHVIAQLKANGAMERGWLGVEIQPVTPDIAESVGLDGPNGAIVTRVMPDGPAKAAGLRQGDVILKVAGEPVMKVSDLTRAVAKIRPGSRARFDLMRDGDRKQVSVELGTRPTAEKLASARPAQTEESGETLGLGLATVDAAARQAYGLDSSVNGAVITGVAPDSAAAEKGLSEGDVIVKVGNKQVRNAADAVRRIEAAKKDGRKTVLMLVKSQGQNRFVALPVG